MYIEGFFTYLKFEKRYSGNTLAAYKNDLDQFTEFILREYSEQDKDLLSIHHRQIRSWIVAMMDEKIASKSVNRKISTLKTYFKFLLKKGVISKNPMLKVISPKTPKVLPLFIEKNGMENIFELMDNSYPETTEIERFIKMRDLLVIELLYATGMRRAELLALNDRSLDHSKQNIKVLGKGNKERIIPVSNGLVKMIDIYTNERNRLFGVKENLLTTPTGEKAYPKMIYNIVNKILKNVSTLSRKSPHVLRHTFATHLSNNGAQLNAIKELLGHASLASTQIYTHNTIDQLKKIHQQAHPKG